jgi:hypothetical protein
MSARIRPFVEFETCRPIRGKKGVSMWDGSRICLAMRPSNAAELSGRLGMGDFGAVELCCCPAIGWTPHVAMRTPTARQKNADNSEEAAATGVSGTPLARLQVRPLDTGKLAGS